MLTSIHGREARPASRGWNVCKTLIQTVVFWSIFLFLLPALVVHLETFLGWDRWRFPSPTTQWIGVLLFLAGGSLGLTSGLVMAVRGKGTPLPSDCARELVVVGPYRFIRNPMAVAGLTQGVAVGLFLGSPTVIVYALLGGPVWHIFVRPWEEADLEQRFGPPYQHYRSHVKCWLPRLSGYQSESNPHSAPEA